MRLLPLIATDSPIFRVQHNSSGVFKAEGVIGVHAVLSQFPHKSTVQFRHFHAVQETVHPVEFPRYPVDGQALPVQDAVDHRLPVATVEVHPLDHPAVHVDPIQSLVDAVEVHGHHAGQALQDQGVGLAVCRQVPQVVAVAEDEVRRDVAILTAAVSVRLAEETRGALANVGADGVLAHLTAHARRLSAFVDIVARFAVRHETVAMATGADEARGRVGAVVIAVVDGRVRAFIDTCRYGDSDMQPAQNQTKTLFLHWNNRVT